MIGLLKHATHFYSAAFATERLHVGTTSVGIEMPIWKDHWI
jgi:hypothetical protein